MAEKIKSLELVDPATGQKYMSVAAVSLDSSGNVKTNSAGDNVVNTVVSGYNIPGTIVTPTEENIKSSATTGSIVFNATADNDVAGIALAVDPTDYAEFRTNLLSDLDETIFVRTDSEIVVYPKAGNTIIENIYMVSLGTTTNTGGYMVNATVSTVTTGNVDSAHLQFSFTTAQAVKAVVITLASMTSTAAGGQTKQRCVMGIHGRA